MLNCFTFTILKSTLLIELQGKKIYKKLIDLSICLYIYTSTYLSTYLHFYLSIYLPFYLHTFLPIYLSTYIPIYLYTYLSTYLPTYQYFLIYGVISRILNSLSKDLWLWYVYKMKNKNVNVALLKVFHFVFKKLEDDKKQIVLIQVIDWGPWWYLRVKMSFSTSTSNTIRPIWLKNLSSKTHIGSGMPLVTLRSRPVAYWSPCSSTASSTGVRRCSAWGWLSSTL